MSVKYTFFLKTGKNVVLTDDDAEPNMEKIISELTSVLKSPKICSFSTKNDYVLLKSNEVQGVMIDSKNIDFLSILGRKLRSSQVGNCEPRCCEAFAISLCSIRRFCES